MKEEGNKIYKNLDITESNLDKDLNENLYNSFKLLKKRLSDLAIPGTEIVDDSGVTKDNQHEVPQDDSNQE